MNRTSKFTRLSESLREELNQRLRNVEPDHLILHWLNARPEVLAALFDEYEDDKERQHNFQLFMKKIRPNPDDITPAGQEPKKPKYEEVEEDDDEEEEGDESEAADVGDGAKGPFPKANTPVVRWNERPDDILDEAAIRALHARTADDIRREIAQAKARAAGLAEIKPEEP